MEVAAMTNLLLTLAASLVVNLAVFAALKVGLRNNRASRGHGWGNHQPC
jgi:hypothetical protein